MKFKKQQQQVVFKAFRQMQSANI